MTCQQHKLQNSSHCSDHSKIESTSYVHRVSALDYRFYLSGDETRENFELLSKART